MLRRLLKGAPDSVRYVEHFAGEDGVALFEVCCQHDLEGIVAKRCDSTYLDADHETARLKIKNRSYTGTAGRDELFERRLEREHLVSSLAGSTHSNSPRS